MSAQQNSAKGGSGGKTGKVLQAALFVAIVGGALLAVHTLNDANKFSTKKKIPIPPPEKAIAKKPDKPDGGGGGSGGGGGGGGGGKGMKDKLGGPEFPDAKPTIQTAALRNAPPEAPVKASLPAEAPKPVAASAPPPAPAPRAYPPFPKTNAPTLNLSVEAPPPPPAPPPTAPPPEPPPPPPPPKPRATMLLSNVTGRLSDRADVSVKMAVELTYEVSNALREELEFKRDMLTTVAGSVIRKHEYGTVNTTVLKTDILSAFNGQLQAGKLSDVEIKGFQVEQAVAGK